MSRSSRSWINEMRLFGAGALLLILFTGIAGGAATAPPDGEALLKRAIQQEDHVAFYGRQENILWDGERPEAFITWEYHDGHGRARVETHWPRQRRGQLILT